MSFTAWQDPVRYVRPETFSGLIVESDGHHSYGKRKRTSEQVCRLLFDTFTIQVC